MQASIPQVGIALSPLVGLKYPINSVMIDRRNCPKPVGGIEIHRFDRLKEIYQIVGIALSPLVGLKFANLPPFAIRNGRNCPKPVGGIEMFASVDIPQRP